VAKTPQKKGGPAETAVARYDYGQDAGQGFENQTRADRLVPFINLLQSNSPQVADGAFKAGLLFNSVTGEAVKELTLIPCATERVYVEYVPRDKGSGFVGEHKADDKTVLAVLRAAGRRFGKLALENGNELVESFKLYALVDLGPDVEPIPVVVSFTSTKITVYKKFNTQLATFQIPGPGGRKITPPLWAHRTVLSTIPQENKKGKFFNFVWGPVGEKLGEGMLAPEDVRYVLGKQYHDLVMAEQVHADYKSADPRPDDADDATPF
jgi:hypothetical protein